MSTPNPPPLRTTPLGCLILAPGSANFEVDGRFVRLAGEEAGPSLSAFHAFHDAALADYRHRPPPDKPPGLLSRLRSWLGAFFRPRDPSTNSPKDPSEKVERPVPRALKPPPEPRSAKRPENSPRKQAAEKSLELPSEKASRDEALHLPNDKSALGAPPPPLLQSAFADKEGVHLVWQAASHRETEGVSVICRLDSDVAHKLQECYTQLGKLGYKVVGLDALSKDAEASPPPEAAGGAAPIASVPVAPAPALIVAAPRPPGPKEPPSAPKERPRVPVLPHRATNPPVSVSPAEAAPKAPSPKALPAIGEKHDKTLVLEISRETPPDERLTYLRGTLGRAGLKIAEVGLGEGKDGAPARWEDAARWFSRHAEPEPPKPDRSPLPELL